MKHCRNSGWCYISSEILSILWQREEKISISNHSSQGFKVCEIFFFWSPTLLEYSSLVLCVLRVFNRRFLFFGKPWILFSPQYYESAQIMGMPQTALNFSITFCLISEPLALHNLRIRRYPEMRTCIECWTHFLHHSSFLGPWLLKFWLLSKPKLFFPAP